MARPKRTASKRKKFVEEASSDDEHAHWAPGIKSAKRKVDTENYEPDAGSHSAATNSDAQDEVMGSEDDTEVPVKSTIPQKRKQSQVKAEKSDAVPPYSGKLQKFKSLGKRDAIIALLGAHCDTDLEAEKRDLFCSEVRGPLQSAMTTFRDQHPIPPSITPLEPQSTEHVLQLGSLSAFQSHLPSEDPVKVDFLKPGTRSLETIEMSTYDVRDQLNTKSKTGSIIISTGLENRTSTWCPCNSKSEQYLAIGGISLNAPAAPMYRFEGGPGCIQIWSIVTFGNGRGASLRFLYIHDFGHTYTLHWCPSDSIDTETGLGLLAGVFGDGTIRILSVPRPSSTNHLDTVQTEYRYIQTPAYTLSIPDSSFTCFDWLTPSRIAAGCANGMVVIFDLSVSITHPIISSYPHKSFINNLVSCSPSMPDTILTTSWDCEIKTSNIWTMESDVVSPSRDRMVSYAAAWSDTLNCGVVNEDGNAARLYSARLGESTFLVSCLGSVTALHCSPHHPFVVVGETSGLVQIANAARKVLRKKVPQYRRRIFQLDYAWREERYRFLENYEVDDLLGRHVDRHKAILTNIFPREIAVHNVVWNRNDGHEGVLASCVGRFLRIDDLAI